MSGYNAKNYTEQGGEATHIGGVLEFGEEASLSGFPGAENHKPKTTNTAGDIRADLNALIVKLKNAGLMTPDAWEISVLACPTAASMPTGETAANSGHATVAIDGTAIKITLDCKAEDLAEADHGGVWGRHKWLGFGVRTGLDSVEGVRFTDDTGASATLSSEDAAEATALGLSAGDFVLYIKAEDAKYLTAEKSFTLWADGYTETQFSMEIVEATNESD